MIAAPGIAVPRHERILVEDVENSGDCSDLGPAPMGGRRTKGSTMKYMIMMFGGLGDSLANRSPEWITQMHALLVGMDQELREAGELVDSQKMIDPSQAVTVRVVDGVPAATD